MLSKTTSPWKFLKALTARPGPSWESAQSGADAMRSAGEGSLVVFLRDTLPTGEGELVTEIQYKKKHCAGSGTPATVGGRGHWRWGCSVACPALHDP